MNGNQANYLRFAKVLAQIKQTVDIDGQTWTTKDFRNLLPQSYSTRLRDAYKYAKETNLLTFLNEIVFTATPTTVIVRRKGTRVEPEGGIIQFGTPQATPVYPQTNKDINTLLDLLNREVLQISLRFPGIAPPHTHFENIVILQELTSFTAY
jgi:hypothetical protein